MFDTDFTRFTALLDDIAGMLPNAKSFTPSGKSLFFRALSRFRFEDVEGGLMAHISDPQRGRYLPAPADVIAQIEGAVSNDGRPGADEAWGIALQACDESATVVWTEETAKALTAAQPILDIGDKIGARMAFKNAYERLVTKARTERKPTRWQYSLGHDPLQREQVLQSAVTSGLLPAPQVAGLLPPPDSMSQTDAETARQNTQRLMSMLMDGVSPAEKMRRSREQAALAEQARLVKLKKQSDQKAGGHIDGIWPLADLKRESHELR